jgi:BCD family chlorophyll transporter-like MFS transporter
MTGGKLGWLGIFRLGLVQTALGAIIVLTTSTTNRVMIVELALPAVVPGLLVTWHYALQVLRPRWGHGSDVGGRRTPWIIGGMATLAIGGCLAALSVHLLASHTILGMITAILAFTLIGIGVGAAGTSLLVLLAKSVDEKRRPAAASIVWIMMIAGFILTTALAGRFLDPFSTTRLLVVASVVCSLAFLLSLAAVWKVEPRGNVAPVEPQKATVPFREAFAQVWADPSAKRFAIFIFVSMLAYSAQDLILEPFAGLVFGLTPGQSTALASVQNSGVLIGMVLVGVLATVWSGNRAATLRNWTIGGCIGSALALGGLVMAAVMGPPWPLKSSVFALGFANGVFAVAAIGSMFMFAAGQSRAKEGVRMGLFGASQAISFGIGGFAGTVAVDIVKAMTGSPVMAYGGVFAIEAALFAFAALLAASIGREQGANDLRNPLVLAAQHQMSGN